MRDFFERYDHLLIPEPNTGCLIWLGAQASAGYGHGHRDSKHFYAHRAAFEAVHGEGSLDGMVCRHGCDFPPCCNPDHLLGGTPTDNTMDSVRRGRARRAQGEDCGRAVLTEQQVRDIRELADGGMRIADVRRKLKLTHVKWDTVNLAAQKRTWRWTS